MSSDKDLYEVLMDHDEITEEEDETLGDVAWSDPDPGSADEEDYNLDDLVYEEEKDE